MSHSPAPELNKSSLSGKNTPCSWQVCRTPGVCPTHCHIFSPALSHGEGQGQGQPTFCLSESAASLGVWRGGRLLGQQLGSSWRKEPSVCFVDRLESVCLAYNLLCFPQLGKGSGFSTIQFHSNTDLEHTALGTPRVGVRGISGERAGLCLECGWP